MSLKIDNLSAYFEDKSVLVCGASGMTGHNVFDLMEFFGANVKGTCHNNQEYTEDRRAIFHAIDFTNIEETNSFFNKNKFEYVFICCAKTYNAQACIDNPESMILPNIQMVSNILSNCLKSGVKKVMYISSATVYQPSDHPLKEYELDMNINPHNIYMGIGWVKRYIEKLCEFYSQRGLQCIIVRPTNIYGRYDKTNSAHSHVIPAFVMRALDKPYPFIVNSLGNGIKNFIHVGDLVRDMAKLMATYNSSEAVNLCSDETCSIGNVVKIILDAVATIDSNYSPYIKFQGNPDIVSYLNLDRSKFDSLFEKDSYVSLKDGIKETVEWYYLSRQTQKKLITV